VAGGKSSRHGQMTSISVATMSLHNKGSRLQIVSANACEWGTYQQVGGGHPDQRSPMLVGHRLTILKRLLLSQVNQIARFSHTRKFGAVEAASECPQCGQIVMMSHYPRLFETRRPRRLRRCL
jgi:hypothetical protein